MRHQKNDTIRNIDLRRAILAILIQARGPVPLDKIVDELEVIERIDLGSGRQRTGRERVADVLAWQIETGRVERRGTGVYIVNANAMSRTTKWRCRNWRALRDRRDSA